MRHEMSQPIAAVSTAGVLAFVGMWLLPGQSRSFASLTNLCYLAAGIQREHAAMLGETTTTLIGLLGAAPFPLVFLGASSFGFHTTAELFTPAHTLDIFFGWVLVSHCAYVTLAKTILRLSASAYVRTAVSTGYAMCVVCLVVFYDAVYRHQELLFFTLGPLAAVLSVLCRLQMVDVRPPPEGGCARNAVWVALFETLISLLAIVAAVFAQCGLLGRRYDIRHEPHMYDFWHGNWHLLNAVCMATLYTRVSHSAEDVLDTRGDRPPRSADRAPDRLSALDFTGFALVGLYSGLVIVLKEVGVHLDRARQILSFVMALLGLHALATVGESYGVATYSCPRALRHGR